MVRTRPLPLDFPCLGLGNLVVSQLSCLLLVAWQLGTEKVLQLNDCDGLCSAILAHFAELRPSSQKSIAKLMSRAHKLEVAQWLRLELNGRSVCVSYAILASQFFLSRFGQPASISALVLLSGGLSARHRQGGVTADLSHYLIGDIAQWLECEFTDRKVRILLLLLEFPCLGLGNLAVSQSSCFLLVTVRHRNS
ncbi:hypothetical protein CSKR_114471 [Clonorchis sinensis]|uniref:Uncharacterized protein n=1 Tax=Clonorchis sinensis TaxID=79923 RepID=A0A419PCG1_CLOSI|nr:hypothetical protein CSKR_114471 [Clonorchis sinensis]